MTNRADRRGVAGVRIHFVGAGGVGVSALAELAHRRGARVTASDLHDNEGTARLRSVGVRVFPEGHKAEYADGAEIVVHTSACKPDHVEIEAARRAGAEIVRRAEFLARCAEGRRTLGISGAHGKTTTTAMTGAILEAAGSDPTIVVGGYLRADGANLKVGAGPWFVVEADEYDRSFLALAPEIALVNNLDREHLDVYADMDDLRATFAAFASKVGSEGCALLGIDDPEARALKSRLAVPTTTYGLSADADVRAEDLRSGGEGTAFLLRRGDDRAEVRLRVPGVHNVRNALGAVAASLAAGAPLAAVVAGLGAFEGVGRRFERLGFAAGVEVIDDYAHHPTEIAATLAAARQRAAGRRLVVLFQPHLYSRTRDLAREFAESLNAADVVILAPVYDAREKPVPGVTSELIIEAPGLADRPAGSAVLCRAREDVGPTLAATLKDGDFFVAAGAGDVRAFAEAWLRDPAMLAP